MKNIIIVISLLLATLCNAQIINIKDKNGTRINGAYYQDVDNELNQFVGTYKLVSNNGTDEMTIIFKKYVNFFNTLYYQDVLVGEIKFRKDGVLYFDNLSKINQNYDNKFLHDICGNTLLANQTRPVCEDCSPGQYRADLVFFGRNNECGGHVILQKIIESGQEKMKVSFWINCLGDIIGQPENVSSFIPGGDYILIKQ